VKMEGELKAALSTSRAPQRPAAPDAA
jgi:hypothetical protein